MFGLGKLKFRAPDKSKISDDEHISDYNSAEEIGRVRLGTLGLYYRDLGKKYFVPYDYIDRSFCRISECHPDDSPAYYYYRLILVHGEKEFANLIYEKGDAEGDVDRIIEKLKVLSPNMKVGYIPPADGKRKFFS